MDQVTIRRAQSFIHEEARRRISTHQDYPDNYIIITPEIFASTSYCLPEELNAPVIFISFDKRSPLRIPHKIKFNRPVIISQSVIGGIADCEFNDDLILHDVSFKFNHSLPYINGYLAMDECSLENYREKRIKTLDRNNRTITLLTDKYIRDVLLDAFNKVIPLDLGKYLNSTNDNVRYIKREDTYYVDGDLILHGPIHFTVPKGLCVNGDLIIIDDAAFKLPKKLRIAGSIETIGSM